MKSTVLALILFVAPLLFSACSTTNVKSSKDVFRNQIGTLSWNGPPAADGAGMLFIVDEVEYGAPGEPDDYSDYLDEGEHEVIIKADFKLTGEETVRGWGVTFPEIEFIRIKKY
ncbi:hypothetical protein [Rhodohalobacter sp. 614A]|uniref:hypothetical protein n=1 Tax=Rhodohalobacter sp. 614A TaxID=2908649 RepID=UPI001F1F9E50|nr:hypothetical protein [Rhodohalobacter sp. 614A]